MSNDPSSNDKKYDLEERTAKFGEDIVKYCNDLPRNDITRPLINQLVKCGTAVGANYCEADDAESKADFKHKIGLCKKESRECNHFLRMFLVAVPEMKERTQKLWTEAKELNLIFNSIYKKLK
ncbi:MAG: four helix bundle protein [Candidatus Doudnabacteria bacterium]|nr:four helix bundle protein [Candidatus Doudnabacteria bacterium]